MRFKPILLLCTLPLMLLLSTCKDEDVLPAATQNGSNTLGCKINGNIWLPKGNDAEVGLFSYLDSGGLFYTSAFSAGNPYFPNTSILNITIPYLDGTGNYPIGLYSLDGNDTEPTCVFIDNTSCHYGSYPFEGYYVLSGNINITKYDMQNFIVAGTFEATFYTVDCDTIRITEGRFDVKVR